MNVDEMKLEFLTLYDKITNFSAPGYEDDEISIFLTQAQEQEYLQLINVLKDDYKRGFESTEKRRKDLAPLVKSTVLQISASQIGSFENGVLFDLPSGYGFTVSEKIKVESDNICINNKFIDIEPITHDEYRSNIDNPFRKPETGAWRLDFDNKHEVILPDNTQSLEYKVRYIKKPVPILLTGVTLYGVSGPLDCELGEAFHRRIVNSAVRIATGVTNPEEYKIKIAEEKQAE